MASRSTTSFDEFIDEISFYANDNDDVETAYALYSALLEREGGPHPFDITTKGEMTFVKFDDSSNVLTLVLASTKAWETFCSVFEKRCLGGDAESHIGFMRAMANPKA